MSVVPGLELVVVNAVSVSEDEEVVLLIAFAGFVLHVPVVLSRYLIVVSAERQAEKTIRLTSSLIEKNLRWHKDVVQLRRRVLRVSVWSYSSSGM